jgi:hypothetical protein
MSNPNQDAIDSLFGQYGEKAAEQMVYKMRVWQSKVEWQ